MKYILILIIFCFTNSFKASAQDTVEFKNISAYTGKKVTVLMQAADFDLRQDYIFLHMGKRYPNQAFSVIIKRNNNDKKIKLNNNIVLGRAAVSFTGYLTIYDGEPDTTKNYNDKAIKRKFEEEIPAVITALNAETTIHMKYQPRTEPIDLRGKLVMMITQQKQIGKKYYSVPKGHIGLPSTMPDFFFGRIQ